MATYRIELTHRVSGRTPTSVVARGQTREQVSAYMADHWQRDPHARGQLQPRIVNEQTERTVPADSFAPVRYYPEAAR